MTHAPRAVLRHLAAPEKKARTIIRDSPLRPNSPSPPAIRIQSVATGKAGNLTQIQLKTGPALIVENTGTIIAPVITITRTPTTTYKQIADRINGQGLGATAEVLVSGVCAAPDFGPAPMTGGRNAVAAGTAVTDGLNGGDLTPWFNRCDITNTGNDRVNHGTLVLQLPADGTFVSKEPVLIDDQARARFYMELSIWKDGVETRQLRGILGKPTIINDVKVGRIISIPVSELTIFLMQSYYSRQDFLLSPKDRFLSVLGAAQGTVPLVLGAPADQMDLPEGPRQDWPTPGPTTVHEAFQEVIGRTANPTPGGGILTDYYWDWEPQDDPTTFFISVRVLGEPDSGIVVSPTELSGAGGENTETSITDNLAYRDAMIMSGAPGAGTLPVEAARFRSEYLHARLRPDWQALTTYALSDRVRRIGSGNAWPPWRYFVSKKGDNRNHPPPNAEWWDEDFTLDPQNSKFYSPNPWYNRAAASDFLTGLAGGTTKCAVDWNVARNMPYEHSAFGVRYCLSRRDSPPATPLDGDTYLVGTSQTSTLTGDFAGHRNQVANYNHALREWHFTQSPQHTRRADGSDARDMAHMKDTATVLAWKGIDKDGNAVTTPDWETVWDPVNEGQVPAPFHVIYSTGWTDGPTGIPDDAIELRYNWSALLSGDISGRGVWWSTEFPHPTRDVDPQRPLGRFYKGTRGRPHLDTVNLDHDTQGRAGWHRKSSEQLGTIRGLSFKTKIGFYSTNPDEFEGGVPALAHGYVDIPMIWWAQDRFDRVVFRTYTHRYNGEWDSPHYFQFASQPNDIFVSRTDEMARLFGWTLPVSYYLKQKEPTGIEFDWRRIRRWGTFCSASYDPNSGLFVAYTQHGFDFLRDTFNQLFLKAQYILPGIFTGNTDIIRPPTVLSSSIALGDITYDKDLYVISSAVERPQRVGLQESLGTSDYLNLQEEADAALARSRFFPQYWFVTTLGNPAIRFGQTLTLKGQNVPPDESGEQVQRVVPVEVKHILDNDGYKTEMTCVRKFVVDEDGEPV